MAYFVEVITTRGTFTLVAPEDLNTKIDIIGPLDWAEGVVASGADIELADCSVLRLKSKDGVIGYRVYNDHQDAQSPSIEQPAEGHTDGGIIAFTSKTEYLGNKLVFDGWRLCKDNEDSSAHIYYIIHHINSQPAYDVLASEKLKKVFDAWAAETIPAYVKYTLVTPPGPLADHEEAREYLKDYVTETAEPYRSKEKTAKAWTGWGNDTEKGQG